MSRVKTWDDFIRVGHKMTIPGKQYMLELSDSDSTSIEPLLFQRGGGYFDASGQVILDNETAVQTMCWFVPLVAGPHKIANSVGFFNSVEYQSHRRRLYALLCLPRLALQELRDHTHPYVSGKMALMPLPTVVPARTGDQHLGRNDGRNHQALSADPGSCLAACDVLLFG